jgi:hypothetical protein
MEELLVMSAKERERLKIFERVKNGELQRLCTKSHLDSLLRPRRPM